MCIRDRVGIKRRENHLDYTGEEEFNYFLAVLFPSSELSIWDYNRVVADLNGLGEEEFLKRVEEAFTVEPVESEEKPAEKHTMGTVSYTHLGYRCRRLLPTG